MRNIIARQYGGVIIERGICIVCGDPCIICKDDTSSCCNGPVKRFTKGIIIKETSGSLYRKRPKKELQKKILEEQNNKCYWCGREFGMYILSPHGIVSILRPVWDHYIPYIHSGCNDRFVASCSRCNFHKSSFIITDNGSEQKLRERLIKSWHKGGWKEMEENKNV